MGSQRRWDTTRAKLEADGVTGANLDRVRSPIGIDISAETPEEIAISILAEVIERRSAS
jgi:xanthine dehydrogenase accessory factor